jgi:N-acyl-D-aspartate/D-glutamate deacylase
MPAVLRRIERARQEGLDVVRGHYPWAASSNALDASLPLWVREGGREKMVARLQDAATRARVRADFPKDNPDWSDQPGSSDSDHRTLDPSLKHSRGRRSRRSRAKRTRTRSTRCSTS